MSDVQLHFDTNSKLLGRTGYTSTMGQNGSQGPAGSVGENGYNSSQGLAESQGPTASQGPTGSQGPAGSHPVSATGYNGSQGPVGATGYNGSQCPVGVTGYTGPTGQNDSEGTQSLNIYPTTPILKDSVLGSNNTITCCNATTDTTVSKCNIVLPNPTIPSCFITIYSSHAEVKSIVQAQLKHS